MSPVGGYLIVGMKVEADIVEGDWLLVRVHRRNFYKGKNLGSGSGGIDVVPTCKWGWSKISEAGNVYLRPADDLPLGVHSSPNEKPKKAAAEGTVDEEYNLDDFDEDFDSKSHQKAEMATSKARTFSFTQRTPSKTQEGPAGDRVYEWTQCTDEHGQVYYYNVTTMESRWEPPEWVEETDPNSGASYYVKLSSDARPLHSTWSKPQSFARLRRAESRQAGVDDWDQMLSDENIGRATAASLNKGTGTAAVTIDDDEDFYEEETYEYEDDDFETELACNKYSTAKL
jgi:hypothetical protein